ANIAKHMAKFMASAGKNLCAAKRSRTKNFPKNISATEETLKNFEEHPMVSEASERSKRDGGEKKEEQTCHSKVAAVNSAYWHVQCV
ncbi:unnamed protein product, partial [Ceratitis capitata]